MLYLKIPNKKWTKQRNGLCPTGTFKTGDRAKLVLGLHKNIICVLHLIVLQCPLRGGRIPCTIEKKDGYICWFMPAGDNNKPNLMASPYLGLRHPVLWKGHQCQRKNEKFSDNFSLRCNCGCAGVKPLSKRRGGVLSWSWRWLKLSQTDISWPFLQIAVGSMSVSMGQWLATSSVPMGFSGTIILTPVTSHGILNVILEVPKTTCTQRHVCICYGS